MATADTTSTGPGWRFLAGGLMLAVMAAWIWVNHDPPEKLPAAVVGLAALLGLAWGGARLGRPSDAATLRSSGMLAAVGGVAAGAVSLWLALSLGREAFGEVLGLAFFSLVALATGCSFVQKAIGTPDAGWERLGRSLPIVAILLLAAGFAALAGFIWFALMQKVGLDYAPELVGLLIGGFVLAFAGVFALGTPNPEPGTLRLFFVVVGPLGVVLTFVSIGRGYLWTDQIFRAGIAAWSGAEGWRFWLVAYLFLGGLGLIFASLGLSISQVRTSATLRKTLFGYVSVFSVVFLLIVLIMVNVLVYLKVPYTFNWSKTRGLTALSPSTKSLLTGLQQPTSFYVLIPPGHIIYSDLKNLLDNSQAYSNKLNVKYIDPDRDIDKYSKLANRFKEMLPDARAAREQESGRGVLIVYGDIPDDANQAVPHSFVPERRLYSEDMDRKGAGNKVTITFKAEAELMKELDFLAQKKEKRKLYFLQGDDEFDIATSERARPRLNPGFELAPQGAGKLAEMFRKNNYDVKGLSFHLAPPDEKSRDKDTVYIGEGSTDKKPEVPEDCHTLVILGPGVPLPQGTLDAIERYLDRGGRLLAFLDLVSDRKLTELKESGLEGVLKKYGVQATNEFLVRVPQQRDVNLFGPQRFANPSVVLAIPPAKAVTVLAKQFAGMPMYLSNPRVIRPGDSQRYKVEPLLVTPSLLASPIGSVILTESTPRVFADFDRYFQDRLAGKDPRDVLPREPVPVAVTVTEGTGDSAKPRMVVFGDAEFVDNDELTRIESNFDIAASAVEWMSERGFGGTIGPRPKETSSFSLTPGTDLASMFWGTHWTLTMLLVIVGTCIWIVRRR